MFGFCVFHHLSLACAVSVVMRPSSVGGAAYCVALCLSVCLSVCPSVPLLLILEHRSRVFVNLADVRHLLFCLHVRAAYSRPTAISAAQACYSTSASDCLERLGSEMTLSYNLLMSTSSLTH